MAIKAKKTEKTPAAEVIEVPVYTIRADSLFGIRCMMMVRDMSHHYSALGPEERKAIAVKLREFDLYEEQTRD